MRWAILFLLLVLTACVPPAALEDNYVPEQEVKQEVEPKVETAEETGELLILLTDRVPGLEIISKVKATISAVRAYQDSTGKWVTLSDKEQTVDLFELKSKGKYASIGKKNLDVGMYSELRLDLKNVEVGLKDGTTNIPKLPGNVLRMNTDLTVKEGKTTIAIFDFLLDRSFHITGADRWIMVPVLTVEVKENAELSEDTKRVTGNQTYYVELGMNINGGLKKDYVLPAETDLKIENDAIELGVEEKEEEVEEKPTCEKKCEENCKEQTLVCRGDCRGWADRSCGQDTPLECIFYCPVGIGTKACPEVCNLETKGDCKTEYRKRCVVRCEDRTPRCIAKCPEKCVEE